MQRRLYSCLFLLFCCVLSMQAQTYQGQISGVVRDQSGAVIPSASVRLVNEEKGVTKEIKSNSVGEYVLPNLEPGLYSVKAESSGFKSALREHVRLEVARSLRLDFQLQAGSAEQTVSVSGETPLLDTTTATLEGVFTNDAIVSLPLQGRDFQNLVTLRPGIQRTPGGGFMSISSNGNRPEDNNYLVDGIDDNDAYYGGTVINAEGVSGTPATHLPIDAIQEFNVKESPEAEYGSKPGAIVQLGIKSGTNNQHGTAYYFGRNSAADARNYFNPKTDPVSTVRVHQFGGSWGGPIQKDKLFYFVNYEGVRSVVGNPVVLSTPVTTSLGDSSVSLTDAIANCGTDCNPLSLRVASYYPQNLGTYNPNNPAQKPFDFNNTNREDNGIVKVDYHPREAHTFSGRYFIGDSFQVEEDSNVLQPMFLSHAKTRAQVLGGAWGWTPSDHFVNQLRFGYNRFWQKITTGDADHPASYYGINTGVTDPLNWGFPTIMISGFNSLGGSSSWPLLTTPNQNWQISDNVIHTIGKHSLKYGGEFHQGSSDNTRNRYGKGRIEFRDLDHFMAGDVRRSRIFLGDSHRELSLKSFGFFVSDQWRATQRLTIIAGLRYDVTMPLKEAHNQLANFDPAVGLVQVGKQISSPYNTDKNNFAPRIGLAYDVFGNGTTVLRAGGGIMYEMPHISLFVGQNSADATGLSNIPTAALNVSASGGTINSGLAYPDATWSDSATPIFGDVSNRKLDCDPSADGPCAILGVDRNLRTPYIANWNLNLQQQITPKSVLQIAYVGNRGIKLYSIRDINQNVYGNDVDGDELSGRPLYAKFPTLSFIDMLQNKDSSMYHGLQVTYTQRPMKGLDFVAGYTWAKSIDIASGNRASTWEDTNNPLLERGPSGSDIRHRFTLAMTYALPSIGKWQNVTSGWQFSNIATLETGEPLDYYDGYNDFSWTGSYNDRWNAYGDPGDFKWGFKGLPYYASDPRCDAIATAQNSMDTYTASYGGCYISESGSILIPAATGKFGNMRRNSMRGPGYANWDASLSKSFKLREWLNLQFRGEVFNILNHPNFAGVDHDLSNGPLGTVGIPIYTPDVRASNPVVGSGGSRHIQLGAKFVW